MVRVLIIGVFALQSFLLVQSGELYKDATLFKVVPTNEEQVQTLKNLGGNAVLWSDNPAPNQVTLFHVKGVDQTRTIEGLREKGLHADVVAKNLQKMIDEQKKSSREQVLTAGSSFSYECYHEMEGINRQIDKLGRDNPDTTRVKTLGKSYEGRDIKAIEVSISGFTCKKPLVLFECGIHGREWISPAACLWVLNKILTVQTSVTCNYDFAFIIVINPDGYVYSWTSDRMWRKTRSIDSSQNGTGSCVGVDANRNCDIGFGGEGSSPDSCSQTYSGACPFSEPETQALRDYVQQLIDSSRLCVYFAPHSYSQLLLFPYGYTDERIPNYDMVKSLAAKAVAAIQKVDGKLWKYGPVYTTICKFRYEELCDCN